MNHLRKIQAKIKPFRSTILHHRKKLNMLTAQQPIYYIQHQNRKSELVQMPEAAIGGILRKKVFLKIQQNLQETLVPEKAPVNFAKFLGTAFLQNNSGRLHLKCGHSKNEAREIDCLCYREVDVMLIASTKTLEREGNISLSNFYGHLPDYQSICVDEFFWFLVQLKETRRLSKSTVVSFCFWC